MIDAFIGSITDYIADSAVDSIVNKAKDSITANTTYVWTAVNKETHSGKIANLIFVNTIGQRQRVAYEDLDVFIRNNYVSNVMFSDGKIEILGCSIYDLPDYRLGSDGQYRVYGTHDENWVYNKALPYIQSKERKIQEDKANKCLKSSDNKEVQTNITGNIRAIKDISVAAAVTSVTVAGAAGVAGVAVAGKAIYNQVNKKKLTEIQVNIYKKLERYEKIIDCIIKMKSKTNNLIESNPDIVEYNSRLEAEQETTGMIKSDIIRYGISGCITKIESVIEQSKSTAVTNKILDLPIKNSELHESLSYGTLGIYINKLNSRLDILKQQHERTRQLILFNRQTKIDQRNTENLRIQQEQEKQLRLQKEAERQNNLGIEINELQHQIENKIRLFNDINNVNIEDKAREFNSSNIQNLIISIKDKTNQITDFNKKHDIQLKVMEYQDKYSSIQNKINKIQTEIMSNTKNDVINTLNSIESSIEELMQGNSTNERYLAIMNDITNKKSEVRVNMEGLLSSEKAALEHRLESLSKKLEVNQKSIEIGIKKTEADQNNIVDLENLINKYQEEIKSILDSKEIKKSIDKFTSSSRLCINKLNNQTLTKEWRQKVSDKQEEFNNLYQQRIELENNEKERLNQLGEELIKELKAEIQRISDISIDDITNEKLKELDADESILDKIEKELRSNKFELSISRDIKDKLNTLKNTSRRKKNDAESILTKEKRAIDNLTSELLFIEKQIDSINKYNKDGILRKLNNIETSLDYNKLREREWVDKRVKELKNLYENKLAEIG